MKKIVFPLSVLLALAFPIVASAHQVATYHIGSGFYQIVIGSLNEPVVVDDKTGIDLTITKCASSTCASTMNMDGDMDGPAGTAVSGLEHTLKAEIIAGDQKQSLSLSPQYGKPGAYTSAFFATVATTFSYHFTGTIDNAPVDLMFTCVPSGTLKAPMDSIAKKLSDQVTQLSTAGGFGCALEKANLGFPEQSASIVDLQAAASNARTFALVGIALGASALAFSFRRRK